MKISKFQFIKILAKHISLKLSHKVPSEQELIMMVTSLTPMFNAYTSKMKFSGILDFEDFINIDKFEKEANDFFIMIPTINIPLGSSSLPITKKEVDSFITELYSKGIVEDVIYLPCLN